MATLNGNTLIRHPDTGEVVMLAEGVKVPEWASDLVGDHLLHKDEGAAYDDLTVEGLRAEIAARNEGRDEANRIPDMGKKADLVAALEADDN